MRLEDLAIYSRVEELLRSAELLAAFRAHEKVKWDEKTDLYSYKVSHSVRFRSNQVDRAFYSRTLTFVAMQTC